MSEIKDFSAFLASRRTTRDFLPTPVDPKVIEQLITDGLTSPSWSNTRPIMVGVATGEVRDRISAEFHSRWNILAGFRHGSLRDKLRFFLSPKAWPRSDFSMTAPYPVDLRPRSISNGKALYTHIGVPRGDKKARDDQWARNFDFFGAPVVLFIYVHKGLGVFAANDAGLFAQNLMLSAHAKGLGACAQGIAALWSKPSRREFNVPKDYKLIYGIAIGYPADAHINKFGAQRLTPADITVAPKQN